jgi:hypothetical protein
MMRRRLFAVVLALTVAASLGAAPAKPAKPANNAAVKQPDYHRVTLSGGQGKDLPFTIEIPKDWQMRMEQGYPGLWLGPAGAKPPQDPRLIWVRGSQVSLANPEEVVKNIRANDEAKKEWTAPLVEVRDLGGLKAVLVRMDTGEGDAARSTLTLKLPLGQLGLDLMASADRAEFEKRAGQYERILLSVRPVASPAVTPAMPTTPATPPKN